MTGLVLAAVHMYQAGLRWLVPASCRYVPSCSEYCSEALRRHGLWKGSRLTLRRLARCHPWGGIGYDPVP